MRPPVEAYRQRLKSAKGSRVVDTHVHTSMSDGFFAPAEVVRIAKEAGVGTIVITDHDTVAGVREAQEEGRRLGVKVVAGVELTAFDGDKRVHVKGIGIDPKNPELARTMNEIEHHRRERMVKMIGKLRGMGFKIDEGKLGQILAPGKTSNRGYITRMLLSEKHYFQHNAELFRTLFGKEIKATDENFFKMLLEEGGPAHEPWAYRLGIEEAIRLIKNAGGIADLAHPAKTGISEEQARRFKQYGLASAETRHPAYNGRNRREQDAVATKAGLGVTTGSDYHGRPNHGR